MVSLIFGCLKVEMSAVGNETECSALVHETYEDMEFREQRSFFTQTVKIKSEIILRFLILVMKNCQKFSTFKIMLF
jgi:hypothetical protein